MPKITIDGKELTVDEGKTIIQAADEAGIAIPRYCYHPGLRIVGQCRICLVEIEKMPKLQVACYTRVQDGMVVHVNSERAKRARQQVLEFLLINHPIDCPVCDQAGECWLQEYYMQFGLYDPKMTEDKVKKHKAVVVGPHVVLDSERCILCTRCVRFCDEISKTSELGVFNRGDHAELLPYPGKTLDNPYSVNVVDICPVGALTERDFRFRVRVWYLQRTPSICPGCSTGCNIEVHATRDRFYKNEGRRVARLKPRYNPEVNDYWICDYGRYGFLYVDDASRIPYPQVKENGTFREIGWENAVLSVSSRLKQAVENGETVAVLASPQMTNEDLYALRRFAASALKIQENDIPVTVKPLETPYSDDFLIREDKHPNTTGARLLGFDADPGATKQLLEKCRKGEVQVLLLFHHNLFIGFSADVVQNALAKVDTVIFIGSNRHSTADLAHIQLPACTFAEKDGTFTNYAGRVQRIHKAVDPLEDSLAEWLILRKLSRAMGVSMPYIEAEDVFRDMARNVPAFQGMSYQSIGERGQVVQENGRYEEKTVEAADMQKAAASN